MWLTVSVKYGDQFLRFHLLLNARHDLLDRLVRILLRDGGREKLRVTTNFAIFGPPSCPNVQIIFYMYAKTPMVAMQRLYEICVGPHTWWIPTYLNVTRVNQNTLETTHEKPNCSLFFPKQMRCIPLVRGASYSSVTRETVKRLHGSTAQCSIQLTEFSSWKFPSLIHME